MLDFDASGRLVATQQVLTPSTFATIKPGMAQDEVLARIGRPAFVFPVGWQKLQVWNYRFGGLEGDCVVFQGLDQQRDPPVTETRPEPAIRPATTAAIASSDVRRRRSAVRAFRLRAPHARRVRRVASPHAARRARSTCRGVFAALAAAHAARGRRLRPPAAAAARTAGCRRAGSSRPRSACRCAG